MGALKNSPVAELAVLQGNLKISENQKLSRSGGVASGILPDVEGGIPAARKKSWHYRRLPKNSPSEARHQRGPKAQPTPLSRRSAA